jgi:hypothetical protein
MISAKKSWKFILPPPYHGRCLPEGAACASLHGGAELLGDPAQQMDSFREVIPTSFFPTFLPGSFFFGD